ncbi:MAG: flavodoxin-dependent (E)-4-hydroxy-3-methylbut-2-enyl-diphosphate synthase [Clostridia bacterium]|nr:flavodoxin-dependent (E)-4-hydroxy-3-methylbut-2-enyl-diphosphate synthase [Clostridia bacterium]
MTKQINVGNVKIGGGAPISVQSMTNTDTKDVLATLSQIERLHKAGCDIIRVTVPDKEAAEAMKEICTKSPIPVVADIHFDYKLALASIDAGVSKVRINPGNIGSMDKVKAVAQAAKAKCVPIRIGVNGGSLEKDLAHPTPENMVESARRHIKMLEDCDFYDMAISLKSSDVKTTVEAYRLASKTFSYPLHVGVTEAGTSYSGIIRSSAGIGALLLDGIGDTLRVSLTADPVEEVKAGIELLKTLDLRGGAKLISCPTCGRTKIDLIGIASEVQSRLSSINKDITVAVMGCVVNGPGEAKEADIGIAGGKGEALLFKKGEAVRKISEDRIIEELFEEIEKL